MTERSLCIDAYNEWPEYSAYTFVNAEGKIRTVIDGWVRTFKSKEF